MKITWEVPQIKGQGSLQYLVEGRSKSGDNVIWSTLKSTNKLYALFKPSELMADHVRICAANDVGHTNRSCSKRLGELLDKYIINNQNTCSINIYV